MSTRLEHKVAIISGGAQGIGEAIARLFVKEGARVIIADIQESKGTALATALGARAQFSRVDVAHLQDWENAVQLAVSLFGKVDILVNNAGGAIAVRPIIEEDEAGHRKVLELNVTGTWAGMRAVIPAMIKARGGAIVNISSIDGLVGVAGMVTYAAGKFAVTGMTRSVALEVGRHGIRVNSVHPGIIATPLVAGAPAEVKARLDRAIEKQPLARMGTPEEIARAVLFLASDESSFCTGSSLVVDGGHIAGPHRESLS